MWVATSRSGPILHKSDFLAHPVSLQDICLALLPIIFLSAMGVEEPAVISFFYFADDFKSNVKSCQQ